LSRAHAGVAAKTGVNTLALLALISGGAIIGFAPILVRLSQVGPLTTAFWRLLLAVPVLWAWQHGQSERPGAVSRPSSPAAYGHFIIAGLFFAGDLSLWHLSVAYTTVANATLLVNFAPVFVTLGAWLLFGRRVGLVFVVGMAAALAGAAILVGASFNVSAQNFLGDALALVAAVFYAGYFLWVKRLRNTFSTVTIMAWNSIVMTVALWPAALLSGEQFWPASWQGWLVLLVLAVVIHIGGQGIIAYALAHLPAAFSSVTLLVQPVVATLAAWLLLSEALTPLQAAGAMVVLVGIFVARRGSQNG
jgi:drug/metabolite transporter (DMT)-like permease